VVARDRIRAGAVDEASGPAARCTSAMSDASARSASTSTSTRYPTAGAAWRIVSIKAPKDNSNSRFMGLTIRNQRPGSERSLRRFSSVRTMVQGWALCPLGEREAKSTSCRSGDSGVMAFVGGGVLEHQGQGLGEFGDPVTAGSWRSARHGAG
jgi:hypothetical protein